MSLFRLKKHIKDALIFFLLKPAYETTYMLIDKTEWEKRKESLKSAKRADIQRMRKDEEMENGCY